MTGSTGEGWTDEQQLTFGDALLERRTLPLVGAAAMLAGEIYVRLERAGDRIGVQDALITGVCRRFDLPLTARNVCHFQRVAGLELIEVPARPS